LDGLLAVTKNFYAQRSCSKSFRWRAVSRTNAVFDRPKLEWFNTQYLQKLPIEDLLPEVEAC